MTNTLPKSLLVKHYFEKLRNGEEQGLNYFYQTLYTPYFRKAYCFVKDDAVAAYLAQEAFLRLWLFRKTFDVVEDVQPFLFRQIREGAQAYYQKSSTRFQRSLLQLDGIEDYQEFMLGYELEGEEEEDGIYLEALEEQKQAQLAQVEALLPNLSEQQQLFIRLCLKYSFNYERIAWYLGGVSDYEVGTRVEKAIAVLKEALGCGQKLLEASKPRKMKFEGGLSAEQEEILNMRYELQYSFEEIARALNLEDKQVKRLFVEAYAVMRKAAKSA